MRDRADATAAAAPAAGRPRRAHPAAWIVLSLAILLDLGLLWWLYAYRPATPPDPPAVQNLSSEAAPEGQASTRGDPQGH